MKTWQKYTFYALPLIVVGVLLYYFSDIVAYIVMAWVVSMMGAPLYNFLHKWLSCGLSAGLTLVVFALFLFLLVRLFVPPLITQGKKLAGIDYHIIVDGLEEPIADAKNWLEEKGIHTDEIMDGPAVEEIPEQQMKTTIVKVDSLLRIQGDTTSMTGIDLLINISAPHTPQVHEKADGYIADVKSNFFEIFNPGKIPKLFGSLIGFFGNIMVAILSIFFIAFFFLKEKGLFTEMVSFLVPNDQENQVNHAIEESSNLLVRYFLGLLAQATIITFVTTIVLMLMGFENALLMGFCFAIFNLIPYVGPLLGNLFGVLIVVSSNLDVSFYDAMLPQIIKAVIVFGVMQFFDNFLVQPNIFSRSVKAHPLEIFLIILVGAKMGGVAGMVLAIPAYTVLRVVAKVFFSEFDIVKKLTAGM